MKSVLKKLITGISSVAMLATMAVSPVFADEYNQYGKPILDGVHGSTNLEDMEYIHYEWDEVQAILDSMVEISNNTFTDANLLKFDELDNQINDYYVKFQTSNTLSTLYYNQNPTNENLIEYTHSSQLFTKLHTEYISTMQNIMNTEFGSSMLNKYMELFQSENISEDDAYYYLYLYIYYSSFLNNEAINEEAQAIQIEITNKVNEYFALVQTDISDVEVTFENETMSFSDLQNIYLNEYLNIVHTYVDINDVPEDILNHYYDIENTIHNIKVEYGIDNNTLGQLYIDLVQLYNEYAKCYDANNYIDGAYIYDLNEIKQMSSDIKEYITPVLTKYSNITDTIPLFNDTANQTYSVDTANDISNTVISSVGDEYFDIYNYMTEHNLLVLDDDYLYSQGYTTPVNEYSQAFIYLTFNNSDFYDWFTNGISHEFGHFIDWYNNVDNFASAGMATAENISISFSYLCNDNLNSYFDDTTSNILCVSNTLDNTYNYVNSCFSMNELELYAFENADNITPSDLDQKYLDIYLDYGLIDNINYQIGNAKEYSWYNLNSQIYTTPFYMIDYGMAGLTGLTVLDSYVQDNQSGIELFDSLYKNDYYEYDYPTMMNEGLGIDIYADDYIYNISTALDNYLDSKMSLIPVAELGDINLNGEIDGLDILILKKYLLGMDINEENINISNADINQDNHINLLDLLFLKRMILNV